MSAPDTLARQFLAALAANTAEAYKAILSETAGLRLYRWDGQERHRPRERVISRLREEWQAWPDPVLTTHSVLVTDGRLALEFRIQATDPASGRYVEHERAAFLTIQNDRIELIDLYCAEPVPSARRHGWIAPATLTEAETEALFYNLQFTFDPREWLPPQVRGHLSRRGFWGSLGLPHPGSNTVIAARFSPAEADTRIAAFIEWFKTRGLGFSWLVAPNDEPPDLAQRLEAHGFALAGTMAMMAKRGLTDLAQIPVNPDLQIKVIDGTNDDEIEARLQIVGQCFNWPPEQIAERRPIFLARAKDPVFQEREINYLAYLDGVPVADARVLFEGGVAYLGGASTLPAYRSRHIYSTLLRRRLEDARDRGYHIAAIHAEPMSRRVVSRYGFQEYAQVRVYGWMPVMDLAVIKSLVPDD
jgi:GNAT superfamily N-acetyltransferase